MSGLLQMLTEQLTKGDNLGRMSQHLGADTGATKNAVGAALPVLLGALANNASRPQGAAALNQALDKHDGTLLDNLGNFLSAPDVNDGQGILGHVLGERRQAVETGASKASGVDPAMMAKLLPMLAPIVMGAIGRQRRAQSMDAMGLAGMLGAERQQMEQSNPGLGMLGKLLDQDGDGSVADDIANMGKGLLGGLFKKR